MHGCPAAGAQGGALGPQHGSYLSESYRTIVCAQFVRVAVVANSWLVQRVVDVVVVFSSFAMQSDAPQLCSFVKSPTGDRPSNSKQLL